MDQHFFKILLWNLWCDVGWMFYWNDISAKTEIGTIRINKAYRKHYTQKTLLYVEVNSELIQTSKMKIFALM